MIRVVIADDEAAARSRLRKLLDPEPDLEVVAEAASGPATVAAVREHRPDLLFLDIQMPGMDGFEVLEELLEDPHAPRSVVFVTAYDRYALRAFEAQAVDYLLKPFDDARFADALAHVRQRLRESRSDRLRARLYAVLEESRVEGAEVPDIRSSSSSEVLERIPVRRRDRIVLIDSDEVDWIEAAGDYIRVHVRGKGYLVRSSMSEMDEKLGPRFVRVHRSAIVRVDAVAELSPRTHGDYDIVLVDGTTVRLSRSYRDAVADALGVKL